MKTYGCELCGKRFLDSLRLRMHLLAHSGGLDLGCWGRGEAQRVPTCAYQNKLQPPGLHILSGGGFILFRAANLQTSSPVPIT